MDGDEAGASNETSYAMSLADDSYAWYRGAAIRSRRLYKVSEIAVLVVSSAIPAVGVIWPDSAMAPALLGVVVVILSGLRAIFHWQENYLRFSGAREAIEAQRRLYLTSSAPYDDAASREKVLAAAVTRIEQEEMGGWVKVAAERPKA